MPYDIITFDCYGTLVDWDEGIAGAFESYAKVNGFPFDRDAILATYHLEEPKVQAERFRPYREILQITAERVAEAAGWELPAGAASFLPESFCRWVPFPDTNAALGSLVHAGVRLGILSNVDDDLLQITMQHFTVDFDIVVTALQVESYKPSAGHFDVARKRIGDGRWLHAAQSLFHDIAPATRLGIPSAWINRKNEDQPTPSGEPLAMFSNLEEFATWVLDVG